MWCMLVHFQRARSALYFQHWVDTAIPCSCNGLLAFLKGSDLLEVALLTPGVRF